MNRLFEKIVKHRIPIFVITLVIAVICAFCQKFVAVDYDMNDYLPAESASTVALDTMEEEYDGGIPNARVMIYDITIAEALEIKERIASVEGVSDVTWLDDQISVARPLEFMDSDTVNTYYKDGNALFSVTIDAEYRTEAVNDIREIIGDENAMTGSAVSTAVATESTVSEIPIIAVCGVLFALFVLLLTTTSWAEPFVVLAGLGVAIIINAGSNLIFGEISFVTNAAGKILQLAVSLDYSVFLLHRFTECRKSSDNPESAMVEALCGSAKSIFSSGLTTVIGFLALCLMEFGIGPDLGMALAKGIGISLIVVFTFMPALVLMTYNLIDKTSHRSFMPSFEKAGRFICRLMVPLVIVFAMTVVPAYLAQGSNSYYFGASHIFGSETQLGSDTEKIESIYGKQDTYVLLIPKEDTVKQRCLSDELQSLEKVENILSYVDTVGMTIPTEYLDSGTLAKLNSEHYTRMVITVDAAYEGTEVFSLIEQIRGIAEEYYPDEWMLAGEGVSTLDLRDTVMSDMVKVNLIAIGAVFLVLLLTMKSLLLPVILVLGIETAIWINLSIPYFADHSIFYIAYLIISSIQLGATVDYAILFTNRYLEFRVTLPKKDAVIQTISAVTVSIMTSGLVMTVVGTTMGIVSSHGVLSQLGTFLGVGTLCSMTIVLFVLPGMLYLLDGAIQKTSKGLNLMNQKG